MLKNWEVPYKLMILHCLIKKKVSSLHLNILKYILLNSDDLNSEDITLLASKFKKCMFKKKTIIKI